MVAIKPVHQIRMHRPVYFPGTTHVYALVKHRRGVEKPIGLHDTFFYSLPVRDRKDGDVNSVLAFLGQEYAELYCNGLNRAAERAKYNHGEGVASQCTVASFTIEDLTFNAYNLRMRAAIICNAYCEGNMREPVFEMMITDTVVK